MYSQNDSSCLRSANKSQGCPVPVGNGVCGETNSLEIMKQFNRLYEERMEQVDSEAGGDCLQEKVKLQQEWIRNLTQQNEMLVRAVQELEFEATERVHQLEDKLQKSAQCLCEGEKLLNDKDRTVHELTQKLDYYNSFGDVDALAKELQTRREECESLKQEMAEIRQALTEEVAAKHDEILLLRKDLQIFEDRCLQADKQTAFKEDIIRELRKEIKQLKQQVSIPEKLPLNTSRTPNHKHSQTSQTQLEASNDVNKPYIIVNHSSKKQPGKNTVIYINKDGSVHKEERSQELLKSKDHSETCSKCKSKLTTNRSFFPNCKSENDLLSVKGKLKPVQERSKLTNSTFSRCKTFVDQTKRILNEIEFEELFCKGKAESRHIPVKMHVNYLERIKH